MPRIYMRIHGYLVINIESGGPLTQVVGNTNIHINPIASLQIHILLRYIRCALIAVLRRVSAL